MLLATYGVFAVMGPAIFGFGAGVANEREKGWLDIKRRTCAGLLLYRCQAADHRRLRVYCPDAGVRGGRLPGQREPAARSAWLALLLTHVLAVAPFSLLGLTLGFRFGANAAIALSNLVFIGLAVLGGLWFPIQSFPAVMQSFAQWLPSFHLAELSLAVVAPAARTAPLCTWW